MKTKLLLTKMLLAVAGLCVGSMSAWATTKDVVESYDFSSWGTSHMTANTNVIPGISEAGFTVNSQTMYAVSITGSSDSQVWDLSNRFAVSKPSNDPASGIVFRRPGSGESLLGTTGGASGANVFYVSIVGLKAGDRITLTANVGDNVVFYSSNATYDDSGTPTAIVGGTTAPVSGTEYTITGTGWQHLDIYIPSRKAFQLRKAVVTRSVEVEEAYHWTLTGAESEISMSSVTITANNNVHNAATAPSNCLGLYFYDKWKVYTSAGLRNISNGDRSLVIPGLEASDVIEFTGSSDMTTNYSAKYTGTVSGTTVSFCMENDGDFWFSMKKYATGQTCQITSITVYREKEPLFADGDYYLKNKATGAYFAAGKSWNTQAITNDLGHYATLNIQPNGKYYIDTHITGASHYLTQYLWVDNTADEFTFADAGEGYYTISYGDNKVTAAASGEILSLTSGTGDNTKWKLLTPAEWKAENVARLDAATAMLGVDATFYITAPNFNRNDDLNSAWQGTPTINGLGDAVCNYNAEKFNTTPFDVYQELTGLKPGAYKLTMQGFYRNGTTDDRNAILYANSFETLLVSIRTSGVETADTEKGLTTNNNGVYVPNTQEEAAKAFNNGYYNNELYFVVGEDGALRVGVKKTVGNTSDWAVFDNFQLAYYGETATKTITAAGWATYCSPYALDLEHATGLTDAYIVTGGDGSVLAKTSVKGGTVPANTGLLLKGDAGTATIPVVANSSTDVSANKLVGKTESYVLAANGGYVLMNDATNGLGFYKNNKAFTVGANTAYLPAGFDGTGAHVFYLFDNIGGTTGIDTVNGSEFTVNGEYYNVAGQRVAQPTKGLYIVNGKKVVVK